MFYSEGIFVENTHRFLKLSGNYEKMHILLADKWKDGLNFNSRVCNICQTKVKSWPSLPIVFKEARLFEQFLLGRIQLFVEGWPSST